MRNAILVLVAVLIPSIAHAEFATPRDDAGGDVRPAPTKRTKIERIAPRVAVATVPHLTVDEVLGKLNTVYMTSLQRCYRKSLVSDPAMSGKVMLQFQVDSEGRAVMAAGSTTFDQCVSRAVTTWHFTAPANQSETHYRISLVLTSY